MFKLFAVIIMAAVFAGTVNAQEDCHGCSSVTGLSFRYNLIESVNPEDAEEMEEYFWSVISITPIYNLRESAEPLVGCQITVDLVRGEHPALKSLVIGEEDDWTEQIYFGIWMPISNFESRMIEDGCHLPST